MTYYNRQFQLYRTLRSIEESKHNDFEVIVVDDSSDQPVDRIVISFPVTVLRTKDKKWTNPEPAYNLGLLHALSLNPDIIIVQNAECYHVGDVISYATKVTDSTYFAFSCFSLNQENTFKEHNIFELADRNRRPAKYDGDLAWYNHPVYRPNAFDFCVAVTTKNIKLLNGYDERFSDGHAYGDNNLIERVKILGLQIKIPLVPFVAHQWHYDKEHPADYVRLDARNKLLLLEVRKENLYRAKHIYTKDL
jgi:glycosyltransferase involved in cell wall biosynthesis